MNKFEGKKVDVFSSMQFCKTKNASSKRKLRLWGNEIQEHQNVICSDFYTNKALQRHKLTFPLLPGFHKDYVKTQIAAERMLKKIAGGHTKSHTFEQNFLYSGGEM